MGFISRINRSAESNRSRIVLALDTESGKVSSMIDLLSEHICAVKLNMHLLIPLGMDDLMNINRHVHAKGLQSIADIKLNDIPSTNVHAIEHLNRAGFDAITINPFIGYDALLTSIEYLHERGMGAIALVYMSHPSAEDTYGMSINYKGLDKMYRLFMRWAYECKADGIIVGSTRPSIIRECYDYITRMDTDVPVIFSPGIDAQGGDIRSSIESGSRYIIAGRSIIDSQDPLAKVLSMKDTINRLVK
jgi:orotidine-5'-phosphate decarboxylase